MKKQITNNLMMTFLLAAICLLSSNAALSQTQAILWAGVRPTNSATNTNRLFSAGQNAEISKQSSENLSNNSDANDSQRESIYTSLMRFLFGSVK